MKNSAEKSIRRLIFNENFDCECLGFEYANISGYLKAQFSKALSFNLQVSWNK